MRHIICFLALLLSGLGTAAHAAGAPASALHGTYLHLSDIHLDPLHLPDPAGRRQLAQQLDAAPVDQWEAILSKAGDGTLTSQPEDTDYYLLKSALAAAASQ